MNEIFIEKKSKSIVGNDSFLDGFELLSSAGLAAAGFDPIVPIWQAFFPDDDPYLTFSVEQIEQMTQVFQEVLQQEFNAIWLSNFKSYCKDVGDYSQNPRPDMLSQLMIDTENVANELFDTNTYVAAKSYLAAAALNLVTLSYSYNEASPDNKQGALEIIGETALDILNNLYTYEQQLLNDPTQGLEVFAGLKQYEFFGDESNKTAIQWFGKNYGAAKVALMRKVQTCAPDLLSQVLAPNLVFKFMPYDNSYMPFIWQARDCQPVYGTGPNDMAFFQCNQNPNDVAYYPMGDIFTQTYDSNNYYAVPPATIPYVTPYNNTALMVSNGQGNFTFSKIYDDGGSNNRYDYSAYNINTEPSYASFGQLCTYNGGPIDNPPPGSRTILLANSLFMNTGLQLGSKVWDDRNSGAHDDCTLFSHPQFGQWGLYNLFGFYGGPDSNTVNCIDFNQIQGHPTQMILSEGSLVQIPSGATYYMLDGILRGIPDMTTYKTLFNPATVVKLLPEEVWSMSLFTLGENVGTDSTIIWYNEGAYLYVDNTARPIPSQAVFNQYNLNWGTQNEVTEAYFNSLTQGNPL